MNTHYVNFSKGDWTVLHRSHKIVWDVANKVVRMYPTINITKVNIKFGNKSPSKNNYSCYWQLRNDNDSHFMYFVHKDIMYYWSFGIDEEGEELERILWDFGLVANRGYQSVAWLAIHECAHMATTALHGYDVPIHGKLFASAYENIVRELYGHLESLE